MPPGLRVPAPGALPVREPLLPAQPAHLREPGRLRRRAPLRRHRPALLDPARGGPGALRGDRRRSGRSPAARQRGGPALDEALDRIFGRDHFTLDALFPAARRAAARRLLPRGDSRKRRALEEWDAFIARLRTAPAEVPSGELARLLAENAELGTVVDALPGAEVLRRHLRALAAALERAPEPARLSGLVSLLETAAGAGLHVDLWELRALGWRLASERTLAPLPREALSRLARLLGLPEPVLPPEAAAGTQEPELEEA